MPITSGHPPSQTYKSVAASVTLLPSQSGTVFTNSAADVVYSLPAASPSTKGIFYTFVTLTVSAGTGVSISPSALDKIQGKGLTAADNKDLINSGASDAVGDTAVVVCDGVDGWIVTNLLGTWAREA
jgi:hypothetical protein